jgi:hypothetical protein
MDITVGNGCRSLGFGSWGNKSSGLIVSCNHGNNAWNYVKESLTINIYKAI